MWLMIFHGLSAILLLGSTLAALFHLRWLRRLPSWNELTARDAAPPPSGSTPRCSVVIAARDEEARIEGTVRHLQAQRGVELEIIAVDDRSTDRTFGILRRLASEDARVQVAHVETLPPNWLGKCHACHIGAGLATGDWILFTDADCWMKPDVIARAIRLARLENADHITLTPGVSPETLPARAWHLAFLISMANWASGVNRDRPKAHLGVGAFNLVKTSAYRQSGGYEALRLTVVDDVKLGLLLHRAGKRTRGYIGGDDVECHWGRTARGMIKIMEKNFFAAADFRLGAVLLACVAAALLLVGIVTGLAAGTGTGIAASLAMLTFILPAAILARRLGWSFAAAAITPFVFPLVFHAILNSTWVTLRQGGIRWRETFYPLDELRRGNVQ